ncbi:MAG: leucyl aminopeptidase [Bacillota bacterium]
MQVKITNQCAIGLPVDSMIIGLFQGKEQLDGHVAAVDQKSGGLISRVLDQGDFEGKLNETLTLYPDGLKAKKLVLVGLGKEQQLGLEQIRQAAGSAFKVAAKGKVKDIAFVLHGLNVEGLCPMRVTAAVVEGSLMADYHYDQLKAKKREQTVGELLLINCEPDKLAAVEQGVRRGVIMGEATNLARDLVNAPANYMTPTHMAAAAAQVAKEAGLEIEVLERADMERLGMGCLLGVAQGSAQPPKMIVLRYQGNPGGETLALVGKGLTFDSGGISIKPSQGMQNMKDDMGGGAAVIAAMRAIGQLKPKTNVIGVVPCTENLPSGTALKPGDVLRGMSGKTIEIISTDAEGRLILADAVAYAEHLGATKIVDAATLTGACVVALGNVYAGIVANCDDLVADVQAAADKSGEKFWRLPNHDEYRELYKSDVADIKNGGARGGGAITGGLIISEFIKDAAWAHLDIAAMVITEHAKGYQVKGATGFAARTMAELGCLEK